MIPDRIYLAQLIFNFNLEKGGGGITRFVIDLVQKLDPKLFHVSVYSLGFSGTEAEKTLMNILNNQGIRASAAALWSDDHPYLSFLQAYHTLKRKIVNNPMNILHSHNEFTDVAAILLKLQKKAPIILRTTHYGFPVEWRNRPIRRAILTNFLYPLLFDYEIGVSPSLRDRLNNRKLARLLNREALYVNEAIRLERFQGFQVNVAKKKHSLGIPTNVPIIGCVGRLVEQKGYPYLIRAAEIVIKSHPSAYFVLIGDGPLAGELKSQAAELGILQRVIFTGGRSDVEEILPCLDIFALASLWEGMPISILESMASETPVIATNVPGTRDLIMDGKNGILVPPADPSSMSNAILSLIKNPTLRQTLSHAARETAQQFSMDGVADRYARLYHMLYSAR